MATLGGGRQLRGLLAPWTRGTDADQEAIRLFARNVKEHPDSADAYGHLGEAYAKAGKRELAIESYKKSLELDPENEDGKAGLKKLRAQQ